MHKSIHSEDRQKPLNSAIRLDKWLWAARFFKTRALAKSAIEGGKVHYNKARSKPGKIVELSALVQIRQGWDEKEVIVLKLEKQRRGAPASQLLFEETAESIARREIAVAQRKQTQAAQFPPAKRPTKKQRRQIHRFKESDFEE